MRNTERKAPRSAYLTDESGLLESNFASQGAVQASAHRSVCVFVPMNSTGRVFLTK
jgi:hypothetical protein